MKAVLNFVAALLQQRGIIGLASHVNVRFFGAEALWALFWTLVWTFRERGGGDNVEYWIDPREKSNPCHQGHLKPHTTQTPYTSLENVFASKWLYLLFQNQASCRHHTHSSKMYFLQNSFTCFLTIRHHAGISVESHPAIFAIAACFEAMTIFLTAL